MADILKTKGNEAFKLGQYTEADRLYSSAITLDPGNTVFYANRAITLLKLERFQECITVCDAGLALKGEAKTKLKLLWRRGLAHAQLRQYIPAKQSYVEALLIEPTNTSVLKSLEELNRSESVKRSHSIEGDKSEKRLKSLENIPIYEVDHLPREFEPTSSPSTSKHALTSTSTSLKQPPPPPASPDILKTHHPLPDLSPLPSLQQLLIVVKSPSLATYKYVIALPPNHLKKLLSTGCIDPNLLGFFIDAVISTDPVPNTLNILTTLSSAPRFSLVKLFIEKQKINALTEKLIAPEYRSVLEQWD